MEMNTSEKIRFLAHRKGMTMGDIARGTKQTRQNLSNKMTRCDFKQSELERIAEVLGCRLKVSFVDKETGDEA